MIDDLGADLLALAEIENEAVVRDLMYAMRSDYNYIHRNSGDPRGMDVVLLYRGSRFFPTRVRQIFGRGLTRGLLTVDGELLGEPVTLLLCHLPSQMNAARYRAEAFRSLRRTVDSLLTARLNGNWSFWEISTPNPTPASPARSCISDPKPLSETLRSTRPRSIRRSSACAGRATARWFTATDDSCSTTFWSAGLSSPETVCATEAVAAFSSGTT